MPRGSDIPAGPLSLPGISLPVICLSAMTVPVALAARAHVLGRRRVPGPAERAVHVVRDRRQGESVFAVTLTQRLAQFLDEAGLPGSLVPLRAALPRYFEHRVRVHLTLLGPGEPPGFPHLEVRSKTPYGASDDRLIFGARGALDPAGTPYPWPPPTTGVHPGSVRPRASRAAGVRFSRTYGCFAPPPAKRFKRLLTLAEKKI